MKIPPPLQKGDKVALVATARKVDTQLINTAVKWLEAIGLEAVCGHSLFAEAHQFAGEDINRAKDLQHACDDPTIRAIWCVRGGYGTVRILDLCDFSKLIAQPKWLIGYSDVTVLHAALNNLGLATIHGPMASELRTMPTAITHALKNLLFKNTLQHSWEFTQKPILYTTSVCRVTAPIVGGNLSVLYSLCGSKTALNTANKILFLEDVDEYLYHIDRMMQNLKRNGVLKNLKAILVGGFTKMHDNKVPFGSTAEAIIANAVAPYKVPVVFNFPAGHIANNLPFVLGGTYSLTIKPSSASMVYNTI